MFKDSASGLFPTEKERNGGKKGGKKKDKGKKEEEEREQKVGLIAPRARAAGAVVEQSPFPIEDGPPPFGVPPDGMGDEPPPGPPGQGKKRKRANSATLNKLAKKAKLRGAKSTEKAAMTTEELALAEICPENVMEWLLKKGDAPTEAAFLEGYWEKKHLLIRRGNPLYYSGLFSEARIFEQIKEGGVNWGTELNASYFLEGKRTRHTHKGPVKYEQARELYDSGYTLQLLAPQHFSDQVARLNAALEARFGCLFGANAYLTPPGSQGLAPHWDDVDVFIMQLEGSKTWKVKGLSEQDRLPLEYSKDLTDEEVGEPDLVVKLDPGDFLFLPRGTIHQASTESDTHSLHLTVSTYQKWSYFEFLSTAVVTVALENAARSDPAFREGMPVNYLKYLNSGFGDKGSEEEKAEFAKIEGKVKDLLAKVPDYMNLHEAGDLFAMRFLANRMDPKVFAKKKKKKGGRAASEGSTVKWVDPCWQRMVIDTDPETMQPNCVIYHCAKNDRSKNMVEGEMAEIPEHMEFDVDMVPAISRLFQNPEGVRVCDLDPAKPHGELCLFAEALREEGLLEVVGDGDE